jgi:hypothetical protein
MGERERFLYYDEFDPLRKIMVRPHDDPSQPADVLVRSPVGTGWYDVAEGQDPLTADYFDFLLGFRSDEDGGIDVLFGDGGNDWLVGGTNMNWLFGGWGDDYLNVDDNHDSTKGTDDPWANTTPGLSFVPLPPGFHDIAYGGAGRDVLIANSGADRLIDWAGEFNSYIVPFRPFGNFTISRAISPGLIEFLYDLAAASGADIEVGVAAGGDEARNGEPFGELGLVLQRDRDWWRDQTGAPADPQAGNHPGGRDVLRYEDFSADANEAMSSFAVDSGTWSLQNNRLESDASGGDAVALFHVGEQLPTYFEVFATVSSDRARAGVRSNAYLVFDYHHGTNFKFAGIDISTNQVQIGRRTASGWQVLVTANRTLQHNRDYDLLLAVDGQVVTFYVDGVAVLTHVFTSPLLDPDDPSLGLRDPLWDGLLGIGSRDAVGRVTRIGAQIAVPEMTFETSFDLSGAAASDPEAPSWTQGPDGLSATGEALRLFGPLGTGPLQVLVVETTVTVEGRAGLVFDHLDDDRFKFVLLDPATNRLLIGHRVANGWFVDIALAVNLTSGTAYDLAVRLVGNRATVLLGGAEVASFAYHSLVNQGPNGLLVRDGTATFARYTVRTDDPALASDLPALSVRSTSVPEGDAGATAVTVVVELSRPSTETVTVDWRTEDGSGVAGTDYEAASGTLTFAPGQTRAELVVHVIGNTDPQPDRTFRVVLHDPVGATLGTSGATVTILDDDAVTTVGVVGEDAFLAGLVSGSFTITRDGNLEQVLVVKLDWGGTAAYGLHYTVRVDGGPEEMFRPGTVTFEVGATTVVITVIPKPDTSGITQRVTLAIAHDAAYTAASSAPAVVRIVPDSALPTLSISSLIVEQPTRRNQWVSLTITLSAPSETAVSFTVRSYDGTARAHIHYTPYLETVSIAAGQTSTTMRVRILSGSITEPIWFTVELSNPTGAILGDSVGVVWIVPAGFSVAGEDELLATAAPTAQEPEPVVES